MVDKFGGCLATDGCFCVSCKVGSSCLTWLWRFHSYEAFKKCHPSIFHPIALGYRLGSFPTFLQMSHHKLEFWWRSLFRWCRAEMITSKCRKDEIIKMAETQMKTWAEEHWSRSFLPYLIAYQQEHLLRTCVAIHLTGDGDHLRTDEERADGKPPSEGRLHDQAQD